MTDFDIRLVAYHPNGDRLGVLPDADNITFGDIISEVSSLSFAYPSIGRHADWLLKPIEVAVEYWDGVGWSEVNNGRFLNLSEKSNAADENESWEFAMPGYAWQLNKVLVLVSAADRTKTGKRRFSATPGSILRTLMIEAKNRGAIPTMAMGFTATEDSSSAGWETDDGSLVTVEYEPGTTILSVLQGLTEMGHIEWRMEGRALRVFNGPSQMSQPRAWRSEIDITTLVDISGFIGEYSSLVTDLGPDGAARVGTAESRKVWQSMVQAMLTNGIPYNRLDRGYYAGRDSTINRPVSLVHQSGQILNDTDSAVRSFGAFAVDRSHPNGIDFVIGVPQSDSNAIDIAKRVFDLRQRTGVYLSGLNSGIFAPMSVDSFYVAGAAQIAARKIAMVDVRIASENMEELYGKYDCYVQYGGGISKTMVTRIQQGLVARGVTARVVPSDGRGATEWRSESVGREFGGRNVRYARIQVNSSFANDDGHRSGIAYGIRDGMSGLGSTTQRVPQAQPKMRPPGYPEEVDGDRLGPVDLLAGRDLLEAPTTRTRDGLLSAVYAFGDSWASTLLENQGIDLPWGRWEAALGAGGIDSGEGLIGSATTLLDQGTAERVEMIRKLTFLKARWFPYQDYDCGDYVLTTMPGAGQPEAVRIQQLSISKSGDDLSGQVTMDVRLVPREIRANSAIRAASGSVSGTLTGGSGTRPVTSIQDTRVPTKPGGKI